MLRSERLWTPGPLVSGMSVVVVLHCTKLAFGEAASNALAIGLLGYVIGYLVADYSAHLNPETSND